MSMTTVTATQFDQRDGLGDWRYLLGRLEATFRAGSFDAAARLCLTIAGAAEAADHHPDVDLRYPDHVHIMLTTHAVGASVTERDVALAQTISELAADAGAHAEPQAAQTCEVAIDALDIDAVRPFWQAVLGYVPHPAYAPGDRVTVIVDPARVGPQFWFQQMDRPRPQRNRIHIDVTVPHDIAEARLAEAVAAGGRVVSDAARAWWVLADSEGNEACISTWQDRD